MSSFFVILEVNVHVILTLLSTAKYDNAVFVQEIFMLTNLEIMIWRPDIFDMYDGCL